MAASSPSSRAAARTKSLPRYIPVLFNQGIITTRTAGERIATVDAQRMRMKEDGEPAARCDTTKRSGGRATKPEEAHGRRSRTKHIDSYITILSVDSPLRPIPSGGRGKLWGATFYLISTTFLFTFLVHRGRNLGASTRLLARLPPNTLGRCWPERAAQLRCAWLVNAIDTI